MRLATFAQRGMSEAGAIRTLGSVLGGADWGARIKFGRSGAGGGVEKNEGMRLNYTKISKGLAAGRSVPNS